MSRGGRPSPLSQPVAASHGSSWPVGDGALQQREVKRLGLGSPGPNLRQVLVQRGKPEATAPELATRLRASKPVTWRGRGDLSQVPWTPSLKGTWLVLDLWAGISGLCIALLQMGLHFYGVAAECDEVASMVAQTNMTNLVHVPRVEDLSASIFVPLLQRRNFRGVIIGGGSPCQGNSSLNVSRQGLQDPRSQQPLELKRLRQEFESLPEMQGIELVVFLENVGSMPDSVRDEYSSWLGAAPLRIEAGRCGWVRRRRLYWLASRRAAATEHVPAPPCWAWEPAGGAVPELCYAGDKPLPNRCFFSNGYQPTFSAKEIMKQRGEGAMHPFTREFFHPTDRTSGSTSEAVERFFQDHRRFPPSSYEAASLVWRDSDWRQPLPAERAQLMGIPPESLDCVPGAPPLKRQRQNSLLGNGFHLFSVMAVFCLLPALLEAKMAMPLLNMEEEHLRQRVWEPG